MDTKKNYLLLLLLLERNKWILLLGWPSCVASHSWHHYQDKNTFLGSLFWPRISEIFDFYHYTGYSQFSEKPLKRLYYWIVDLNNLWKKQWLYYCLLLYIRNGTVDMHKVVSRGRKVLVDIWLIFDHSELCSVQFSIYMGQAGPGGQESWILSYQVIILLQLIFILY